MTEDNIDYKFNEIASKTIKRYREIKGLSLEDVVKKMKKPISRQSLFKYENNLARMKNSTFNDICNALDIDANEVFSEINTKLLHAYGNYSKETNQPIDVPLINPVDNTTQYAKVFATEKMLNDYVSNDGDLSTQENNNQPIFDELELLFDKHKDILTDDDKETIKFLIEKRKREIDKQLGEN